jgi:hypothetical protein
MTPDAFAEEIKAALVPHADPQRALAMRAYMRHHFDLPSNSRCVSTQRAF